MEFSLGVETQGRDIFSIVPKVGCFLGLDISERSTGLTIIENGERLSVNFSVNSPKNECFREVRLRRALKDELRRYILGKCFDIVIIEDVFQGLNPVTTRVLYALNTAIDELVIDGEVECKEFKRLDNGLWKSGLFSLDTVRAFKGMSDKNRIEECLNMLGIHEVGGGFQDRLDSLGMIVGYFLAKDKIDSKLCLRGKKKVSMRDISYNYQEDLELLVEEDVDAFLLRRMDKRCFPSGKRLSKELILSCLSENPGVMYVAEGVSLGSLGKSLGLSLIPGGGCFAAWVSISKRKKYIEEEYLYDE